MSIEWITPVVDRTADDVAAASAAIAAWQLEDSPVITDLKGCLNASDLNRIENNLKWIVENNYTYRNYIFTYDIIGTWSNDDLLTTIDVEELIANEMNLLITILPNTFTISDFPSNIDVYDKVNLLEQNLYISNKYMVDSKRSQHYVGATIVGEMEVLYYGNLV